MKKDLVLTARYTLVTALLGSKIVVGIMSIK